MRIAIDAEPANRVKRTGVENIVLALIENFTKLPEASRYEFLLFTKDDLRADFPLLPANFKHIKAAWPTKYFWAHLRFPLSVRFYKPDVVFVAGNFVSPLLPKPIVTVIHDLGFMERPEVYSPKSRASQIAALQSAVKNAAYIITATHAVTKTLFKYFPRLETPVLAVPWAHNKNIFRVEPELDDKKMLERFNLSAGKYFIAVGRLEKKKNTDLLIQAYARFKEKQPGYELVLVGEGNVNLNVVGIKNIGYQSDEILSALYRQALALVHPSAYEGFGLPLIEAQACGCPVLSSDIDVLREVAGTGAYYFNPDNSEDFNQALVKTVEDSAWREQLRQNGLSNSERFDWIKTSQKILAILADVV